MDRGTVDGGGLPAELRPQLARIFREDCGYTDSMRFAGQLAELFAADGPRSSRARDLLENTGVRRRWNHALSHERSRVLAASLRPLLFGRVADVLSGDGTLTREIAGTDIEVTAFERTNAYPTPPVYPTRRFEEFAEQPPGTFDCLLISTVLHHEQDPEALLQLLAQAGARRWVVVENCITARASAQFHEFIDVVFNETLNSFDVPCTTEHRDVTGWLNLLRRYGSARLCAELETVPGIPFSYEVFIVDTAGGGSRL